MKGEISYLTSVREKKVYFFYIIQTSPLIKIYLGEGVASKKLLDSECEIAIIHDGLVYEIKCISLGN